MRIKLKIPNYRMITKTTFAISIGFMVVAFISFIWTLICESTIYFDFTSQGWSDFLDYYSPQIKIAGVGIALFALWMTAARMKQTEDQIRSIVENNRFNNFFKHRDEFVKYFSSQQFMINLAKYSNQNLNDLLLSYHGMFFTRSYENFESKLNKVILEHIKNFCNTLNEDNELNYNIAEYIASEYNKMPISTPSEFYLESTRAFDYLTKTNDQLKYWFDDNKTTKYIIQEMCHAYYTYRIYMSVIGFAGEKYPDFIYPQFISNLISFFDKNGLSILKLD